MRRKYRDFQRKNTIPGITEPELPVLKVVAVIEGEANRADEPEELETLFGFGS